MYSSRPPRNPNAADFVHTCSDGMKFGLSSKCFANALRSLADDFDAGLVVLQKIDTSEGTALEDFPTSTLRIEYSRFKA